jgi:uncharacterized RDD family membrane protein YckC
MGFGRRLIPAFFDGLFIAVLGFTILLGVGLLSVMFGWLEDTESIGFQALAFACGLGLSFVYYVGAWTGTGQTGGMTLAGVKVTSVTGARPTFWQAVLRYIGFFISALPLALGFLWVAFDKRRQGWHDKIARTYVIDADEEFTSERPTEFVPSDADHNRKWTWAAIWLVFVLFMPSGLLAAFWLAGPIVVRLVATALGITDD